MRVDSKALAHRLARWWLWTWAPRWSINPGTVLVFQGNPIAQTVIIEVGDK